MTQYGRLSSTVLRLRDLAVALKYEGRPAGRPFVEKDYVVGCPPNQKYNFTPIWMILGSCAEVNFSTLPSLNARGRLANTRNRRAPQHFWKALYQWLSYFRYSQCCPFLGILPSHTHYWSLSSRRPQYPTLQT